MPIPIPNRETMLNESTDRSVKKVSQKMTPSAATTATPPIATGMRAATTVPNTITNVIVARGNATVSPRRKSSPLASTMSRYSGGPPVMITSKSPVSSDSVNSARTVNDPSMSTSSPTLTSTVFPSGDTNSGSPRCVSISVTRSCFDSE